MLKNADFELANNNEIYKTGVIRQFNLTFKLAWKAVKAVLRAHGVESAATGSPREILQMGYKYGFVDDSAVWLLMLKKRNASVHIYDEDKIDEMLLLIRDSFIPAFIALEETLRNKFEESRGRLDVKHSGAASLQRKGQSLAALMFYKQASKQIK